jgi:CRP/FNR family transcriptional regulator, cyclic AMP receptor protein
MNSFTLIEKALLLKSTHLFKELDLDLLLIISEKLGSIRCENKQKIFSIGQEANRMFLISQGTIAIKTPKKEHYILSKGEFFGDESLFNQGPRTYEATSLTQTNLLTLSRTNLLAVIAECPSVAINLLEVYTKHIVFRNRSLD